MGDSKFFDLVTAIYGVENAQFIEPSFLFCFTGLPKPGTRSF